MPKTIGIDASRLESKEKTGVEIYSKKLIEEILKLPGEKDLVLYSRKKLPSSLMKGKALTGKVANRYFDCERFFTIFFLQKEILRNPPEILFVPSAAIPFKIPKKTKCITTIHDVAFHFFPELYSSFERFYLRNSTKRAIKNCSKIIVPSEATKEDLVEHFHCPEDKIEKIEMGFEMDGRWGMGVAKKKQFLFVGRIEEKKNLINAIKGFKKFSQKFPDYSFLLCGKPGFGYKKIRDEAREIKKIKFLGFVSEAEKIKLIRESLALVLPSFYEGFGFPILEAQSLKTLVLCSEIKSNLETSGGLALFFNPESPEEIFQTFEKSLDEKEREELVKKASENVGRFSWERCARETFGVLRKGLQRKV